MSREKKKCLSPPREQGWRFVVTAFLAYASGWCASQEQFKSFNLLAFLVLDACSIQGRHRLPMVALHIEALAAIRHRSHQDGFPGAIVIARIALGGLFFPVAFQRDQVEDARG